MDTTKQPTSIISVCTGIRGLDRGVERAFETLGWPRPRTVAYVEIEAFCAYNLVTQMEAGLVDPAPVWTDAKTFPAKEFYGKVDWLIGGYPCPGESLAGLRQLHQYHGWLWPALRRIIQAMHPMGCFFENVGAHLTGTYPIVYRSLRLMGYRVEAGLFSAEEVGAPHERERLFILAISDSIFSNSQTGAERLRWKKGTNTDWRSERSDMDNTNSFRVSGFNGSIRKESSKNERQASQRKRNRNATSADGKEMGNTDRSNTRTRKLPVRPEKKVTTASDTSKMEYTTSKRHAQRKQNTRIIIQKKHTGSEYPVESLFPAAPGFEQYDWEEPRTIKPGMGCTIDGYNFRSDLLRALGNAVEEHQAEKAFITLSQKIGLI